MKLGYVKDYKKHFKDKVGELTKRVQIKRLEKYADLIDSVLTPYNRKSCDKTMMIKGLRKSCQETTNRKTHQENLANIVGQMAEGIGLRTEIVKIMGKYHDIGHTFLGHEGEEWISNILEDYGMGYFCHNTLGASNLIYGDQIYNKIVEKIKTFKPKISNKELKRIKESLWLILDGINAHNGEKPEKEYIPQSAKTEEDLNREMLFCYTKKHYDRTIMPATIEGCLMRLADQISYIPYDMVDRNTRRNYTR